MASESTMKAVEWHGTRSLQLADRDIPTIVKPTDAIVRITSTSICGSDLHLYNKEFDPLKSVDIPGHEFMGVVEQVGSQVKNLKPGNRVVCSFCIACGSCRFCQNGLSTCCDCTNASKQMAASYGHCISGMFGYSDLLGGYSGGQAELVRVPCADTVCLKLPSMDKYPDEKFLLLSDVMCTGFHATECGAVGHGQTVAVWGLGPIGQMALAFSKFRGAARIIGIDYDAFRLEFARSKLGAEVIDISKVDVVKTLHEMVPHGIDVAIDAAGFRFPTSTAHKMQRALHLETDSPEIIYQAILSLRKGGFLSIVGDYFAEANNFPIGALMEKAITLRGGQTPVQRYWPFLLDLVLRNEFDPSFIITHIWPFERAVEAYDMFNEHKGNCLKVVLKTAFGTKLAHDHGWTTDNPVGSTIGTAPLQTDPPVYIKPTVVARLPWSSFPSFLSPNRLQNGELTCLFSSLRLPSATISSSSASGISQGSHFSSGVETHQPTAAHPLQAGASQAVCCSEPEQQPGASQALDSGVLSSASSAGTRKAGVSKRATGERQSAASGVSQASELRTKQADLSPAKTQEEELARKQAVREDITNTKM